MKEEVNIAAYPDNHMVKKHCVFCNERTFFDVLPPLTAMQPDNLWAGHMIHGQAITSKSYLNRYRKQNNLEKVDESVIEHVKKKADRRISDAMDKSGDNLKGFLEKELSGVEVSNDGNTVKEQNKFNKVRQ
jgi:hypothetical protein